MNKFAQLVFVLSNREVLEAGRELCRTASSPEELRIARAYRRVNIGTVILAVCFVISLIIVMILNDPFLASGDRRYGTVQSDGSIGYVHNNMKYASAEQLGLSEFDLSSGERVVIFFDKDDQITAAYPTEYYDNYTNTRIAIILMTVLLGITVMVIYALVICRVTPFGRPWYIFCRKLRELGEPKLSKKQTAAVYIVSVVLSLVVCAPQIMGIIDEIRSMQEAEAFGRMISDVQQAADKAQEMTDALNSFSNSISENSGVENAKNAAEKVQEIADSLNSGISSADESSGDTAEVDSEETQETKDHSEETAEQTSESSGLKNAVNAADNIHDILNGLQNNT